MYKTYLLLRDLSVLVLTVFTVLNFCTPAFSSDQDFLTKTPIAVLNLEISSGIAPTYSPILTDRLCQELIASGKFMVMERSKMTEILDEIGFQISGCTSNECVIQAGRILGVGRMLAGSVGKIGEIHTVSVRLIDVETSEIVKMESVDMICSIEEVLTKQIRQVVQKLVSGETQTTFFDSEFMGYGSIELNSSPSGALVFLDGTETRLTTPTVLEELSSGRHTIKLVKNNLIGSKNVFVIPNVTNEVSIELRKGYGSLKLLSDPDSASVWINGNKIGDSPFRSDTIPAGTFDLAVKAGGYNDYTEKLNLDVNDLIEREIQLQELSSVDIASFPPGSKVYKNREYIGDTPLTINDQPLGDYTVVVKHRGYKSVRDKVTIKPGENKDLQFDLIPKTRNTAAFYSLILPGSGQIYSGSSKGYLIMAVQLAAAAGAFYYTNEHSAKVSEYEDARTAYLNAVYPAEIESARQNMDNLFTDTENLKNMRDITIIAAGAVYLYNVIDIALFTRFPGKSDNIKLGMDHKQNSGIYSVKIDYNF